MVSIQNKKCKKLVFNFHSFNIHLVSKITPQIHKNIRETPNLSVTNGKNVKPKFQGGSMATFSSAPHLIMLMDINFITILNMLQTNWTWYNDWQDKLLSSSIIHAKTNNIFKVMKMIGIFHHDCFPNYFWNGLCESVAIFTNLQTFYYLKRGTRSYVDEPKCNSYFLAMVIQVEHLFFFFHILHEPCQSL